MNPVVSAALAKLDFNSPPLRGWHEHRPCLLRVRGEPGRARPWEHWGLWGRQRGCGAGEALPKAVGWGEGPCSPVHAAPVTRFGGAGSGASPGGRVRARAPPALLRSDGIVARGGAAAGKSLL